MFISQKTYKGLKIKINSVIEVVQCLLHDEFICVLICFYMLPFSNDFMDQEL